jgi:DNA-binding transcriptional ArsR family regulator
VLVVTGRSASNEAADEAPLVLTADVIEDMTAWQTVLRHVRRAGDAGLTCLEFEGETGKRHGAASAAFHSCERKRYITRLEGVYRANYAVYVTVSP